jgi:hypothetical protein
MTTRRARLHVGQPIRHRRFDDRGVIVERGPEPGTGPAPILRPALSHCFDAVADGASMPRGGRT